MKKLKHLWLSIPRPYRAVFNALLCVILIITFYVCIGAPTLTMEQAFRRAEKANLVGPSKILESSEFLYYDYDRLILAETEDGVITFVDDPSRGFNYHEKTGDITVVAAPKGFFFWGMSNWQVSLPVFVVDDYPEAARAELELHITGALTHSLNGEKLDEPLDHHYCLTSHREQEGYFHFSLDLPFQDPYDAHGNERNARHGADGYALDLLARTFTNFWTRVNPVSNAAITAAVRLYNEQDDLIAEKDLILRTMEP